MASFWVSKSWRCVDWTGCYKSVRDLAMVEFYTGVNSKLSEILFASRTRDRYALKIFIRITSILQASSQEG
jgi:hypothetical protein